MMESSVLIDDDQEIEEHEIEPALDLHRPGVTTVEPEPARRTRRGGLLVVLTAALLLVASIVIIWWLARTPESVRTASPADPSANNTDADTGAVLADSSSVAAASLDAGASVAGRDLALVMVITRGEEDGGAAQPRRVTEAQQRRRRFGRLDLNASPWAKVYIGGRYIGETPLQGIRLRAGRHRVRLVNPERRLQAVLTVRVRAGRTVRKSVRLRP